MSLHWTQHGYAALGLDGTKWKSKQRGAIHTTYYLVARVRKSSRGRYRWRIVLVYFQRPTFAHGANGPYEQRPGYAQLRGVLAHPLRGDHYETEEGAREACIAWVQRAIMREEHNLTDCTEDKPWQEFAEYLRKRGAL